MKAKPIKGKLTEKRKTALQEVMADGFKPTLTTILTSPKHGIHLYEPGFAT
ncbi:MAG: hypothetical protein JST02_14760 [Bacteroidetes bacterium]|nr:hypothetical protein [Bacteroidota bacterium]